MGGRARTCTDTGARAYGQSWTRTRPGITTGHGRTSAARGPARGLRSGIAPRLPHGDVPAGDPHPMPPPHDRPRCARPARIMRTRFEALRDTRRTPLRARPPPSVILTPVPSGVPFAHRAPRRQGTCHLCPPHEPTILNPRLYELTHQAQSRPDHHRTHDLYEPHLHPDHPPRASTGRRHHERAVAALNPLLQE